MIYNYILHDSFYDFIFYYFLINFLNLILTFLRFMKMKMKVKVKEIEVCIKCKTKKIKR